MVPLIWNFTSNKRNEYHILVEHPGLYVYFDSRENTAYNRICSMNMDKAVRNFIIKMLCICVGGFGAGFSALYASFILDNKTSTTELKIPFVDDENVEVLSNYFLQSMFVLMAFFVYYGIEMAMTIFESYVSVAPELIHNEFCQLIEMYEQKQLTESQLRAAFKNALIMVLDYQRYVFMLLLKI